MTDAFHAAVRDGLASGRPARRRGYGAIWRELTQVIWACMLVDMKTRFGASLLSYLVAIAWPLSHMAFLMAAFLLANRVAPVGDDPAVFAGSGLLPYMLCLYPARLTTLAVAQNKFLLNIQVVKPIHLLVSRFVLEALSAMTVCMIFYLVLLLFDVHFIPADPPAAAAAIFTSIYLGIGCGAVFALGTSIFGPFTIVAVTLMSIGIYMISGCLVPYALMPRAFQAMADYNPIYHCVEWLRASYSIGAGDTFSIVYVLNFATIALFFGLAGERFMRGKYL